MLHLLGKVPTRRLFCNFARSFSNAHLNKKTVPNITIEEKLLPSLQEVNVLLRNQQTPPLDLFRHTLSSLEDTSLLQSYFDKFKENYTPIVSDYNIVLQNSVKDYGLFKSYLLEMKEDGIEPNLQTYGTIVQAHSYAGQHQEAVLTFENMLSLLSPEEVANVKSVHKDRVFRPRTLSRFLHSHYLLYRDLHENWLYVHHFAKTPHVFQLSLTVYKELLERVVQHEGEEGRLLSGDFDGLWRQLRATTSLLDPLRLPSPEQEECWKLVLRYLSRPQVGDEGAVRGVQLLLADYSRPSRGVGAAALEAAAASSTFPPRPPPQRMVKRAAYLAERQKERHLFFRRLATLLRSRAPPNFLELTMLTQQASKAVEYEELGPYLTYRSEYDDELFHYPDDVHQKRFERKELKEQPADPSRDYLNLETNPVKPPRPLHQLLDSRWKETLFDEQLSQLLTGEVTFDNLSLDFQLQKRAEEDAAEEAKWPPQENFPPPPSDGLSPDDTTELLEVDLRKVSPEVLRLRSFLKSAVTSDLQRRVFNDADWPQLLADRLLTHGLVFPEYQPFSFDHRYEEEKDDSDIQLPPKEYDEFRTKLNDFFNSDKPESPPFNPEPYFKLLNEAAEVPNAVKEEQESREYWQRAALLTLRSAPADSPSRSLFERELLDPNKLKQLERQLKRNGRSEGGEGDRDEEGDGNGDRNEGGSRKGRSRPSKQNDVEEMNEENNEENNEEEYDFQDKESLEEDARKGIPPQDRVISARRLRRLMMLLQRGDLERFYQLGFRVDEELLRSELKLAGVLRSLKLEEQIPQEPPPVLPSGATSPAQRLRDWSSFDAQDGPHPSLSDSSLFPPSAPELREGREGERGLAVESALRDEVDFLADQSSLPHRTARLLRNFFAVEVEVVPSPDDFRWLQRRSLLFPDAEVLYPQAEEMHNALLVFANSVQFSAVDSLYAKMKQLGIEPLPSTVELLLKLQEKHSHELPTVTSDKNFLAGLSSRAS